MYMIMAFFQANGNLTGGSINSATIGSTIPSTGTFTSFKYDPDYGRWSYTLPIGEYGGNVIGDNLYDSTTAPPTGTTILVDNWYRHPFNTEDKSASSWCTFTACSTGASSTTAASWLLDAGTYRIKATVGDLYSSQRVVVVTKENVTQQAGALTSGDILLRSVNSYGGFTSDPGDTTVMISGYITLATQTRIYVMKNQGNIDPADQSTGSSMSRVGLSEYHAEMIIELIG